MNTRFRERKKIQRKLPSINELHINKLSYFESLQKNLPQQQKLLKTLQNKTFEVNYGIEVMKTRELIKQTEQRIEDIKNKKEEINYYLYAYPLYVKYETCESEPVKISANGIIQMSSNMCKNTLLERYLTEIGKYDLIGLIQRERQRIPFSCSNCNGVNLIEDLSFIFCTDCGLEHGQDIDSSPLSYKEAQETEYVSQYYYKRCNHFNECLAQLQAKENTTIPENVFDTVKEEIIRKRMDLNDLTLKLIKIILKKNNLSKYTENSHTILYKITGKHKITISLNLEEKLKKMFNDIQESFEKHKGNRKNFLNYNYCFYKFFELLGLPEYLEFFPLLKDRHKLFEHDVIWKKICEDMSWDFTACR